MDRVALARTRIAEARSALDSEAVRLPCVRCRYFAITCDNPVAMQTIVSPVTGSVTQKAVLSAADARKPDGPCGPEGLLFDRRSVAGDTIVAVLSNPVGRVVAGASSVLLGLYLFG